MELRKIEHGSAAYRQMIELRMKELLEPIGITRDFIRAEEEVHDILIGAFEDTRLIGCCILTRRTDIMVQLRQMAVVRDWQGSGIGRSILDFAEKIARQSGYQTLIMHARDCVMDFYKKCGYSIEGKRFFEVGIGHHKMRKGIGIQNPTA